MANRSRTARILLILALLPTVAAPSAVPQIAAEAGVNLRRLFIPRSFAENSGQAPGDVTFVFSGGKGPLWFHGDGRVDRVTSSGHRETLLEIEGAMFAGSVEGVDPLRAKLNVYRGNDPSSWLPGQTLFGGVRFSAIRPGIDLYYRALGDRLQYEFRVAPGVDPGSIRLAFPGSQASIESSGNLLVESPDGGVSRHQPAAWQTVGDGVREVTATFHRSGAAIGIQVSGYDRAESLAIAGSITYSSYLGGSGWDAAYAVATDNSGSIYVTGETASPDFPVAQGQTPTSRANLDVFVSKITGSTLNYTTILASSGNDRGRAITVDSSGNVYVAGSTTGANFPVTAGVVQGSSGGGMDAFAAMLDSGGHLVYSTYLGSGGDEAATGIAVDSAGSAYLTGYTSSPGFPTTSAAPQRIYGGGTNDAFVSKLSAHGAILAYSTFLGGSGTDSAASIAIDVSGNAYIGGSTDSSNFPVKNAYQSSYGGSGDGFVAELNASGSVFNFVTYLGNTGPDLINAIALDSSGNIYVAGATVNGGFANPTYQFGSSGGYSAFSAKLTSTGRPLFCTLLGGSSDDSITSLAVDVRGRAWVGGFTDSSDFPTRAAVQLGAGVYSGFFALISSDGSGLVTSGLLGGSGYNSVEGVALVQNKLVLAGYTSSTNLPTTVGGLQRSPPAGYNGFIDTVMLDSAKVGVFRNGEWFLDLSGTAAWNPATTRSGWFGMPGDVPVVGDWNGSGTSKVGIFRGGTWALDLSGTANWTSATSLQGNLGLAGDVPVTGDWNGTGSTKVGVFRSGIWLLDMSGSANWSPGTTLQGQFGLPGDVPVVGDWNGSGTTKVGVFRNGVWILDISGTAKWNPGSVIQGSFGMPGDVPVVGDWDGSGKTKVGIFRNGCWALDLSGTASWSPATSISGCFGVPGDLPLQGDWNGDGRVKVGIFRLGLWQLDLSGTANWSASTDLGGALGVPGDVPVVGRW